MRRAAEPRHPVLMQARRVRLWALAACVLGGLTLFQAIPLSRDLIRGDGSISKLLVRPRYGTLRIPPSETAERRQAVDRLAADFAHVYFSALEPDGLDRAYDAATTLDPWQRASRYPPLVFALCAWTLARLPYGYASWLHLAVQLAVFLVSFGWAFRALRLRPHLLPALLLVDVCLFLTPAGLSSWERGQFSLYVASSHLWLMLGLVKDRKIYVALAALLAFVKWTAFPAALVMLALHLLRARTREQVAGSVALIATFALTTAALLALVPRGVVPFLQGLALQELDFRPQGISLATLLPRYAVKLMPLVLIVGGYRAARRSRGSFDHLVPYLVGVAILSLTYPTLAFEYSVPCLLGLIPFVVHWAAREGRPGRFVEHGFALFLLAASLSVTLFRSTTIVLLVYVGVSAAFMLSPYVRREPVPAMAAG